MKGVETKNKLDIIDFSHSPDATRLLYLENGIQKVLHAKSAISKYAEIKKHVYGSYENIPDEIKKFIASLQNSETK